MKSGLDALVSVRGTRDGILIVLGEGAWDELMKQLQEQLARPNAGAFFKGARVRVETGNRFLNPDERAQLEAILAAHNIHLGATVPTAASQPVKHPERADTFIRQNETTEVLMIHRTLRSGQNIQHAGPVVVYGDVNDGAEIVATGDILIFGKLRGVVHAGAGGDDHATIGAFSLSPPQIRIGSHIARAPEDKKQKARGPEMAAVREGQIVIEPWRV